MLRRFLIHLALISCASTTANAGLEYDKELDRLLANAKAPAEFSLVSTSKCGTNLLRITTKVNRTDDYLATQGMFIDEIAIYDSRSDSIQRKNYTKAVVERLERDIQTTSMITTRCSQDEDFYIIQIHFNDGNSKGAKRQMFMIMPDETVKESKSY